MKTMLMEFLLGFETPFHVGSGTEGAALSDLGILRDSRGRAVLPGSSLKGKLRTTAERLAPVLGQSACLLDESLSGQSCLSARGPDGKTSKTLDELIELQRKNKPAAERLAAVQKRVCDVCWLFGSPGHAARLKVSEGQLCKGGERLELRHGVVLDRDSRTAVPKLKFDYDVSSAGAEFKVQIEIEESEDPARREAEQALIWAVLSEWQVGLKLGGMSSRGLGHGRIHSLQLRGVDLSVAAERNRYLLKREWSARDAKKLDKVLEGVLERAGRV